MPTPRLSLANRRRHHGWFSVLVLLGITALFSLGAFWCYRLATPPVPALRDIGELGFFVDGCPDAKVRYRLSVKPEDISHNRSTLGVAVEVDCNFGGALNVDWVLHLVGPMADVKSVAVQNLDPHESNEAHILQLTSLDKPDYIAEEQHPPEAVVTGTTTTDLAAGLHLYFSLADARIGEREGAFVAVAAPSVEIDYGELEQGLDATPSIPPQLKALDFNEPQVSDIVFDAGRLSTAERVEFASPALPDPGVLTWKPDQDHAVSALIVDSNRQQREERQLFGAGILAGLAASLLVWIAEIVLEAFRVLPAEE